MELLKNILRRFNLMSDGTSSEKYPAIIPSNEGEVLSRAEVLSHVVEQAQGDVAYLPAALDTLSDCYNDLCQAHRTKYMESFINHDVDRAMIALDHIRESDCVIARGVLSHVMTTMDACIPEAVDVIAETLAKNDVGSNFQIVSSRLVQGVLRDMTVAQSDYEDLRSISPFNAIIGKAMGRVEYQYDRELSQATGGYKPPQDSEDRHKLLLGLEYFQQSGFISDDHQNILEASIKALRVPIILNECRGDIGSALANEL